MNEWCEIIKTWELAYNYPLPSSPLQIQLTTDHWNLNVGNLSRGMWILISHLRLLWISIGGLWESSLDLLWMQTNWSIGWPIATLKQRDDLAVVVEGDALTVQQSKPSYLTIFGARRIPNTRFLLLKLIFLKIKISCFPFIFVLFLFIIHLSNSLIY